MKRRTLFASLLSAVLIKTSEALGVPVTKTPDAPIFRGFHRLVTRSRFLLRPDSGWQHVPPYLVQRGVAVVNPAYEDAPYEACFQFLDGEDTKLVIVDRKSTGTVTVNDEDMVDLNQAP